MRYAERKKKIKANKLRRPAENSLLDEQSAKSPLIQKKEKREKYIKVYKFISMTTINKGNYSH